MSKAFRFSVLSNDVDLDDMISRKPLKEKVAKTEINPMKKPVVKQTQKTIKKKKEKESLQALAFGGNTKSKKKATLTNGTAAKSSTGSKKLSPDCNGVSVQKPVSEDWQNRDQQFVEEENERGLREALMLSKLDFEANKDQYLTAKDEAAKAKKKKKKDKPVTISLSDFNMMDSRKLSSLNCNEADRKSAKTGTDGTRDDNFFADVDQAVRKTIMKETRQKQYTENLEKEKMSRGSNNKSGKSSSPQCTGSILVPISEVEKRDFEIQALRLEVDSLKLQLEKVKIRNSKLCEVLGTAEMRSVGEVIIELKKVSSARDEFSAEVASLSEQLEQEKTKVSQLQQDKNRKK